MPFTSFNFLGLKFQTWGVFFAIAMLVGLIFILKEGRRRKISQEIIYDIYFIGFFSGIVGARLFFYLSHPQFFNIKDLLYFWDGGYVLFGGALFALAFIILYLYLKKEPILGTINFLTIPALISLVIVRIGSFLNLDNIGNRTSLPWGINFLNETRHPIDLYFIILDLILLFCAIYLVERKNKATFLWIVFLKSLGRLLIHPMMIFISPIDKASNLIFWGLSLFTSMVVLGRVLEKAKNQA